VRERCIIGFKNSEIVGASIEEEAEALRQAIEVSRHIVDDATPRARM
jgi:hypothetical protein